MALTPKRYLALVYNNEGVFLSTWSDFAFTSFTKELNGGLGPCVLTLARPFDYSDVDVSLGNEIEIRVSDKSTIANGAYPDGAVTIYRGYISAVDRSVDGGKETLAVTLLGFYTLLAVDVLKDGSQTTLYSNTSAGLTPTAGSQGASDIGLIMRAVIDQYRSENTNPKINYAIGDIPLTSVTAIYRFEQKTYRDAMDSLRSLAPENVYWYCNAMGLISFKPVPTDTTHSFVFGRHFSKVRIEQTMERIRNFLLIWNGEVGGTEVYRHYENAASVAQFGRRVEVLNDYGVDDADAADAIGEKFLAENAPPSVKLTCTVIDDNGSDNLGYDIESIEPGDTCSFYGFDSSLGEVIPQHMIITSVTYAMGSAEITVEIVRSGIVEAQSKQGRKINDIGSGGLAIPETYS